MSDELEPCPLCGNKRLTIHKPSFDIYGDATYLEKRTYISCDSCDLFMFGYDGWADSELYARWNRRVLV